MTKMLWLNIYWDIIRHVAYLFWSQSANPFDGIPTMLNRNTFRYILPDNEGMPYDIPYDTKPNAILYNIQVDISGSFYTCLYTCTIYIQAQVIESSSEGYRHWVIQTLRSRFMQQSNKSIFFVCFNASIQNDV